LGGGEDFCPARSSSKVAIRPFSSAIVCSIVARVFFISSISSPRATASGAMMAAKQSQVALLGMRLEDDPSIGFSIWKSDAPDKEIPVIPK
jgi:hypothetical protein